MTLNQFILPNRNSPFNNTNGLVLRILMVNARNQSRNNPKMILPTFGNIHFHFQKMQLGIPIFMHKYKRRTSRNNKTRCNNEIQFP